MSAGIEHIGIYLFGHKPERTEVSDAPVVRSLQSPIAPHKNNNIRMLMQFRTEKCRSTFNIFKIATIYSMQIGK